MKRNLILCCAGALLLCVTACSDTDGLGQSQLQQQSRFTLTAHADSYTSLPETRTVVGGAAADGSLEMLWSPGDSIGVFSASGSDDVPYVNSAAEASATAVFTGSMDAGSIPAYAYYPYSAQVTSTDAIPVEIPTNQSYSGPQSVAQYDVKAATVTADGADGYQLHFRNMAALVRFDISLTDGYGSLASDERLWCVEIETGDNVTGSYTYDLGNIDGGLVPAEGGGQSKLINLAFANTPSLSNVITAYAVVAPGRQDGTTWRVRFITDKHTVEFTTQALCDFEAGKFYTMPLNGTILGNNEGSMDVAETEETANCYIVTEPGEYSFPATVIGNGQKGIIPGAGFHTETAYISPKSAGLVWSEAQDFVSNVRLEDGRVHYTVGSAYSNNAVIAVYSEPDCQGEILWSWHIWGTIGQPEDEEYTNQAGAKFMVLDREIGAVRVAQYGCLYQWGRKDPFPNNVVTRYWNGTELVKFNTNFGWSHVKIDNATIADAIHHPMELIAGNATSQYNWLGEDNYYLWGDAGRELPDSLYEASAGAGWNQQKTIYDPSPVGYRVANIFTFSGFTKCASGTNADIEKGKLSYINYVKALEGTDKWYFKKNADDTEGVQYQDIRARDGREGYKKKNAGYGGYWWAAEAYAGADRAYACYLKTDQYVQGADRYNEIQTYGRGYLLRDAYAVRCVRE